MTPVRILLVQLFSNGDCLYATAVARQIKADFPGCQLTWAISSSCRTMIDNNPYVDAIWEDATVAKGNEASFRRFLRSVRASASWDRVVVTHMMGKNLAHYDGCIRSALFRGYRFPLSVPVQPVLRPTAAETGRVSVFADTHQLASFKQVILFEFAPLSGQALLTPAQSVAIADGLATPETAVVLSSARKITHPNPFIIDGSSLSIRETAALTHHCSLLIGCSSGLTWAATSDAAKPLPMVQLLNPDTTMINPLSRDFDRFGIDTSHLIELLDCDPQKVIACVTQAMTDFAEARAIFHQTVPLHFRSTRDIVYNLMCYLHIRAVFTHIRVNREVFGDRPAFYRELAAGLISFPFRLIGNFFRKRVLR